MARVKEQWTYDAGYKDGKENGYNRGYCDGYNKGVIDGEKKAIDYIRAFLNSDYYRDATSEEKQSVDDYIKSIQISTGLELDILG